MSISFQTNYASLVATNNLNTINNFQTQTIEQLTSGYRINSSGDDPAGLAVANQYQSQVAELTQGVLNGNDGVNTLQIADGGLSNITTILNRLQTLATDSFTVLAARAGGMLVRVHYNRYLTVTAGMGCVGPGGGGWTYVDARRPGRLTVAARFSLGAALSGASSCSRDGRS